MTDREELEIAVKALDSKKATKITALKVGDLTILGNYFVIASASSTTQVKALADEVEYCREINFVKHIYDPTPPQSDHNLR